jgi:hypothetical protein
MMDIEAGNDGVDMSEVSARRFENKLRWYTCVPMVLGIIVTVIVGFAQLQSATTEWFMFVEEASRNEEKASIVEMAGTKAALATSFIQRNFVELAVASYGLQKLAADGGHASLNESQLAPPRAAYNFAPDGSSDNIGFILPKQEAQAQVPGWRKVCLFPKSDCQKESSYFTTQVT